MFIIFPSLRLNAAILIISMMMLPSSASRQGNPLGEQIIKESKKGVIALCRNVFYVIGGAALASGIGVHIWF